MTDLLTYLSINHHFMTTAEMAEELGIPEATLRYHIKKSGLEPISPADRIREYIQANPGAILEDVAKMFDCTVENVRTHQADVGIKLRTRHQVEVSESEVNGLPNLSAEACNWINGNDGEALRRKRISEPYNQSGSPYGLADKLKNIKTIP